MNYKPDVLDDVFTLAHEAGHSMHSYLLGPPQPYQYYDYTIFVAEVASTFNEQLLSRPPDGPRRDDRERAYLINREIDAIRATIIRQTMFAEFEKITHEMAEAGEPLTVEAFEGVYRELLDAYFGPDFALDDAADRWSAFASRTSTGPSTSTSTPPACRPPSPWPNACLQGGPAGTGGLPGLPPGRLLARTRSTCSATPASTWSSPNRSIPPWPASINWSPNSINCYRPPDRDHPHTPFFLVFSRNFIS